MCRHVFRRVTSALTTLLIFGCGDAIPAEALPYGSNRLWRGTDGAIFADGLRF